MLTNEKELIELAKSGDTQAIQTILDDVQDMLYNLSLRMLGNLHDAEDATQEINIKIIKGLPGFRMESAFSTWVYRICINYLKSYKKAIFANKPLSFEYYAEDIRQGFVELEHDFIKNVDDSLLSQELKASCTNVMLQCLDAEARCIYILGTMFHLDSKIAGEILDISPEAYRKRLSRIRKKMSEFMQEYCGLGQGSCNCSKRIGYAIKNHRLDPNNLEYTSLEKQNPSNQRAYTNMMEELDEISSIFAGMPVYKNPNTAKEYIIKLISNFHLN